MPPGTAKPGARMMRDTRVLQQIPECVGFHLCDAPVCNRFRRYGLLDEKDRIDARAVKGVVRINKEMARWADKAAQKK